MLIRISVITSGWNCPVLGLEFGYTFDLLTGKKERAIRTPARVSVRVYGGVDLDARLAQLLLGLADRLLPRGRCATRGSVAAALLARESLERFDARERAAADNHGLEP